MSLSTQRMRFTPIYHERLREQHGASSSSVKMAMDTNCHITTAMLDKAEADQTFKIPSPQKLKENRGIRGSGWTSRRSSFPKTDGYAGWLHLGRLTPVWSESLNGPMSQIIIDRSFKPTRDAVLPILYFQFDLDNAMPNTIFHYFKHLGLPVLEHRITQVEAFPKGSEERKEAKKDLYRSLNMTHPQPDPEIHSEALLIKKEMEDRYAGFVAGCKVKRIQDGKDPETWFAVALQIFYEDVESTMMLAARKAMDETFRIPHSCFFVADAIWVLNYRFAWLSIMEKLNEIAATSGCRFSFVPMTNGLGLSENECLLIQEACFSNLADADGNYRGWKEWFEKECFAVLNFSKFVFLDHKAKTLSLKTKQNLIDVNYARFWSSDPAQPKELNQWFNDPDRKNVRSIVNKPPPLIADEDEFNLWDFQGGFRVAQLPDVPDDFDSGAAVVTIIGCFRRLVGNNEEQLEYLLNYLACILQQPARKVQQYVAFYGGQGTGKTELVVNFWCRSMLGENNYVEFGSFKEMFEKHEVGWMGKSAVVVNEVEHGDFSSHYAKLKDFTGTISRRANEKCQSIISVDNYARVFMTSNCINAFAEKDTVARRAGLRAAGYHYRDIEDSLKTLRSDNAQRAFYDFLMARDISGWEPERDRLDNELLAGANQQLAFFAHEGKEAMMALSVTLDRMCEIMATFCNDGSRERTFLFPTQVMAQILKANKRFTEDKPDRQWEIIANKQMLAAIHELGNVIAKSDGQKYLPFKSKSGKGLKLRARGFFVNYLELKDKLAEKAASDRWDDVADLDVYAEKALAAIDGWVESLSEKWEHSNNPPRQLTSSSAKTARRVGSLIQVRDGSGALITETADLEEVNKALGEAYVTEHVDENGEEFRVLHHRGKELELNDWFRGDHWATKVEMIYPFYVRDRTA
jgi:hypothetical protein